MARVKYRWAKIRGAYRLSRRGRLRPRRWAVNRAGLKNDFLCLYAAENVVLESLWSTEELRLGSAHLQARIELEGNHIQCADEIRKLEKSVSGRADSLSELYKHAQSLVIAFHAPYKRKRRKSLPATSTGTFPRIQVVPVFQPSPIHIISNLPFMRKGVTFGFCGNRPRGDSPLGTLEKQAFERFSGHAADKVGL